uniref:Uncharacterized protein n=1 Tax=Tetranychus urticae TaxID=32264 RepID=T1KN41_TETUR
MGEQNNNSDKIKFKVKHLNEYHEIVIDRNDERYEPKHQHQQLFEQLESITGVPSTMRYTTRAYIDQSYIHWPSPIDPVRYRFWFINQNAFAPDKLRRYPRQHDILSLHFRDGERFDLDYGLSYEHYRSKHLSMVYTLLRRK